MDALVVALKRAQQDAQEIPLESQIQAREAFLERARKRIAHFDQERAAELLRIQECERRLEEVRALRNAQQVKPRRQEKWHVSNRWCSICNVSCSKVAP